MSDTATQPREPSPEVMLAVLAVVETISCEHSDYAMISPATLDKCAQKLSTMLLSDRRRVAEEEREACAEICDDKAMMYSEHSRANIQCEACARAIRARSNA